MISTIKHKAVFGSIVYSKVTRSLAGELQSLSDDQGLSDERRSTIQDQGPVSPVAVAPFTLNSEIQPNCYLRDNTNINALRTEFEKLRPLEYIDLRRSSSQATQSRYQKYVK
jgi:hypothetical protein